MIHYYSMKLKPIGTFRAIVMSVLVFTLPITFLLLPTPIQWIIATPIFIALFLIGVFAIIPVIIKPKYAEPPYDEENYK